MIEYVLGFYFIGAGRRDVVLIRKNKPAWQRGKWNGVGGRIERGESPVMAMTREFQEEAVEYVAPDRWTKFTELTFPDARVHCFHASGSDENIASPTAEKVLVWATDRLPEDALPNISWLIALALSGDCGIFHSVRL